MDDAIERDYLSGSDEGIEVVEEDPQVARAMAALGNFQEFVRRIPDESAFVDYYADHYGHRLNFESKRFWEEHLL